MQKFVCFLFIFLFIELKVEVTAGRKNAENGVNTDEVILSTSKLEKPTSNLESIRKYDTANFNVSHFKVKENKVIARRNGFKMSKAEDNPYSVILIFLDNKDAYSGSCSGSLLTSLWVLSVAHCFKLTNISKVIVYAGGNSLDEWKKKSYSPGSQIRNSSNFFYHPNYTSDNYQLKSNDVAVVKVDKPFTLSSKVNTIKLSPDPWRYEGYKKCIVTGFGKVQFYEDNPEDFYRKTHELEVRSPCPCLLEEKFPRNTWVCSSSKEGFGVCGNDWGAGLVCDGQIRALASIVITIKDPETCDKEDAGYYRCAETNSISVFQNVHHLYEWINLYVKLEPNASVKNQCCMLLNFTLFLLWIVF